MIDIDLDGGSAESLPGAEHGGPWKPPVWSTGAAGIIAQAKASNNRGHVLAFAAAGRWSQPPTHPSERSL